MALRLTHLNADSTFLLTFEPDSTPPASARGTQGAFTILIDPWLSGPCSFLHPAFSSSVRISQAAVSSLAELESQVDLIIISQDKEDHCHRDSLCSLPRDTTIPIFATPAAAKKIRSWKYFSNSNLIREMSPYHAQRPDTVITIPIDPCSSTSAFGEVTLANLASRRDLAGLHNAIAITYRPPGTSLESAPSGSHIQSSETAVTTPLGSTSPMSGAARSDCSILAPGQIEQSSPSLAFDNPAAPSKSSSTSPMSRVDSADPFDAPPRPRQSSKLPRLRTSQPPLSVLYAPHGTSPRHCQSYAASHLRSITPNGLPQWTALIHSIDVAQNPTLLGGIVNSGTPGALELFRRGFRAKYWIAAHDEEKLHSGFAVQWLHHARFELQAVEAMMREAGFSGTAKGQAPIEIMKLASGEERRLLG